MTNPENKRVDAAGFFYSALAIVLALVAGKTPEAF